MCIRDRYSAEQAAIVCQQCGLNDIQIPLGFNVVIVPHPTQAQCFVVLMNDANAAIAEPLHWMFPLKLNQAVA